MSALRHLLFALVVASLGLPAAAAAQDEEGEETEDAEGEAEDAEGEAEDEAITQRARELFFEGVELSEASQWREAAAKFRQALELKDAPAVRFNLAVALVEMGDYMDAEEQLDAVNSSSEANFELRRQADELLDAVRANTARLTVRMQGGTGEERVFLDGERLADERLGQSMIVRPMRHMVLARRRGRTVARQEIILSGGSNETVTLEISAPTPEEAARAAEEDRLDPLSEAAAGDEIVHWAAFGSVAAVVIATVVVTLVQ